MHEEQHKMPQQPEQGRPREGAKDDPRQAFEEGDPQAQGRTRGHVVDREHPAGEQAPKSKEMQSDRESGRQDAMS
jgi:hypothetical protein